MPTELSDEQRQIVRDLIIRNAGVFSKHDFDLGRTDPISFCIDTGNNRSIAQPLRRHARAYLDLIDQTVDRILKAGIIEPAASPWSANIVLVAKPGSSTPSVTVDYSFPNSITYKDKLPLPRRSDWTL